MDCVSLFIAHARGRQSDGMNYVENQVSGLEAGVLCNAERDF